MYDTITSEAETSHYCKWFLPISNQRTILLPCFQLLQVLQIHLGEVSDATPTHAVACQNFVWSSIQRGVEPPFGDQPEREIKECAH